MDSAFACCAGGSGSIPAVGTSKKSPYSNSVSSLSAKVGRIKMELDTRKLCDLVSPWSKKLYIIILATPSMRRTWYKCEVWKQKKGTRSTLFRVEFVPYCRYLSQWLPFCYIQYYDGKKQPYWAGIELWPSCHETFELTTRPLKAMPPPLPCQVKTYYLAESLSWYSLDLAKHCWTPTSVHNLFMPANSSSENGSVSSMRDTTSITILASPCKETPMFNPTILHKISHYMKGALFVSHPLR